MHKKALRTRILTNLLPNLQRLVKYIIKNSWHASFGLFISPTPLYCIFSSSTSGKMPPPPQTREKYSILDLA